MKLTHEKKVEKFYSHGSDTRRFQDGGYLSFGYWTDEVTDYHQAAEELINRIFQFEKPFRDARVLNVACGYGSETLRIHEIICPEKIIAIDITHSHIEHARDKVSSLNLSDRIHLEKMDACKLDFPTESFNYVIGIEGPAHFNTREIFFQKAYEVLKPNGILLLSDISINNVVRKKNLYNRIICKLCARHWHMPRANWMSMEEMKAALKKIGFKINNSESVGESVFPRFSRHNLKLGTVMSAIRTRGLRIGLGLTFISWLLGYLYRRRIIDYVLLRAIKAE